MAPTYICLDIGEKRIGMAVGSVDVPVIGLGTLLTDDPNWQSRLTGIIQEYGCAGFVLGYPEVKSGEQTTSGDLVFEWKDTLSNLFGLPVMLHNEAYSSVEAERQLRTEGIDTQTHKSLIDERAAVLILQNYLQAE